VARVLKIRTIYRMDIYPRFCHGITNIQDEYTIGHQRRHNWEINGNVVDYDSNV